MTESPVRARDEARTHHEVRIRRDNSQPRLDIEPRRRPPQRRQQHQSHQERRDHIGRDGALIALRQRAPRVDHGNGRVLDHHVQAVQPVRAPAEPPHAPETAQVQRPDLDRTLPARRAPDMGPGTPALLGAAAPQDHPGRVEADKVPGGLEP